jgi:hypothetical protein
MGRRSAPVSQRLAAHRRGKAIAKTSAVPRILHLCDDRIRHKALFQSYRSRELACLHVPELYRLIDTAG